MIITPLAAASMLTTAVDLIARLAPLVAKLNMGTATPEEQQDVLNSYNRLTMAGDDAFKGPEFEIPDRR